MAVPRIALWSSGTRAQNVGATLFVLALVLFAGCGHRFHGRVKGDLLVRVSVDRKLNKLSPVPVDLLFLYDKPLVEEVVALSAVQWFQQREQFRRDYPEGMAFDLWSWEWVPGQKVEEIQLSGRTRAQGVVIFALYDTPGEHRQVVSPKSAVSITLGPDDFEARNVR